MSATFLPVAPLTREAFAPFGDVVEYANAKRVYPINAGTAQRYHDLMHIDVAAQGGRVALSIVRGAPVTLPTRLRLLERHPLGSQSWIPTEGQRFIVVVAPPGERYTLADVRAFVTDGRQGVNYARGVWHHPLLTLGREADFIVVDRDAADDNCEERPFAQELFVSLD